jgi:hypothetical protein
MKTGILLVGIAIALLSIAPGASYCNSPEDCMPGQECVGGVCRDPSQVACSDDFQCEEGGHCCHYQCRECCEDEHCPDGQVCDNYVCTTPEEACSTDADCSDGDACNGVETCVDGNCLPGTELICDDGNACNGVETCVDGNCQPGIELICDDGNACNGVETCDASAGCQPGIELICDDGNACNGVETCDPSAGCLPGTPVVCGNEPCFQCVESSGECEEVDLGGGNPHRMCGGVCVNTQNNDEFCGDLCSPCEEGYRCQAGACVENPPRGKSKK